MSLSVPLPSGDRYIVRYFPFDVVHAALNGGCGQWALALHRRTGWRLAILWEVPAPIRRALGTEPVPVHVFCLAPDGRAVDVEGAHELEALKRHTREFAPVTGRLELEAYASEAQYDAAIAKARNLRADAGRIAEAARTMESSPAYRHLIGTIEAAVSLPEAA